MKLNAIIYKFGSTLRILTDIDKTNNNYFITIISKHFYYYINTYFNNTIPYFINEATTQIRVGFITGILEAENTKIFDNDEFKGITITCDNDLFAFHLSNLLFSCGLIHKIYNNHITINDYQTIKILSKNRLINKFYPNVNELNQSLTLNCIRIKLTEVKDYIKVISTQMTFDIEVEEMHEFFCNGYLTHNSALICIGDYDDIDYLNAKRWDLGNIPNWRCMSNNSVVCNDINKLPEEFWNGYNGNGEPYGLINLELSRKIYRIKDGEKYPDPLVEGYNPCAEQSLANYETCCLSEIYLCNINSYEELKEIGTIVYRICKHSLLLKCHQKATEEIVHKNLRMGIGITGYLQSSEEQKEWLNDLYEYLREYDENYSKKIGAPTSVKLTTVKPSGTSSLVLGTSSGIHAWHNDYYLRRIRVGKNESIYSYLAINHPELIEDEYFRPHDTAVITIPQRAPEGSIVRHESVFQMLERVKKVSQEWIKPGHRNGQNTHNVSATVSIKEDEWDLVGEWMWNNRDFYNGLSVLPYNGGTYTQAPFEDCTQEDFERLVKTLTNVDLTKVVELQDNTDLRGEAACAGGACEIV